MALSLVLTAAIRSRCASTISFELSFFERIAKASSLAEDEMIGFSVLPTAFAGVAMKFGPTAAAAPASATEPKKSRRAILSLIENPILCCPARTEDFISDARASVSSRCVARAVRDCLDATQVAYRLGNSACDAASIDAKMRATRARCDLAESVGWVERQRYPSIPDATLMGFAKELDPPYRLEGAQGAHSARDTADPFLPPRAPAGVGVRHFL
jgi:hypothetical protein